MFVVMFLVFVNGIVFIINLLIANLDAYYRIPISDIQLLIVYHFVAALFICISTYIHIKNNRDERKVKSTKKST